MKLNGFLASGAVALFISVASPASATLLTFEGAICDGVGGSCGNGNFINSNYGSGATWSVSYDADINGGVSDNRLSWWADSYSGLTSVAYSGSAGLPEIFIDPNPGYMVTLHGFDLGAWPNYDRSSQVTILDGLGNILLSTGPITVLGSTPTVFNTGWSSVDGIRIQFGPDSYSVGIDNISFTVTSVTSGVPEPATWAMMLIGFAGLGFAARRRKAA